MHSSESPLVEDLADLYDNAPCGYLSLCPRGKIVSINRTLLDWLGRDLGELLSASVHSILTFGGRIAFETHIAPLLRLQGFVHEVALDIIALGGETVPVIANAAERRGPDGEHQFTRLTMFKAVDRRTFERSLIEARANAEETSKIERREVELREQLMAVLGHDLRNPLAAIDAGLRLLRKSAQLSHRESEIAAHMDASLSRANRLIDDVLDFARGRLGKGITITPRPDQPLAPVLEQVVEEMRAIAPGTSFEIRIDIAVPVPCDPERIGQMASNLLGNALTHGAPSHPVRLVAHTAGDEFALAVTNEGPPIPDAARAQLFQPFFRGEASASRHGLGLGLFIVNEIAKAHGGEMTVESGPGATAFTFRMPLTAHGDEFVPPSV